MRALHYPSSGFKADVPFDRLGFFATSPDVGREAKLPQRLAHFLIVIPFVQTQALRALLGRAWAFHHQTVHGLFDQLHIMPIGARDHQTDRHSVGFGQQAAFDATLGAVGGIGARFFPPRAALSSSPHPCSASSSQSPSGPQIGPPRLSTTSKRPQRPPILGTDHAPWNGDTTRWRPTRPTDTRSAARRKSHRHTADPGSGASPRRSDGGCGASGARARARPTTHRTPEILRLLCSPPPAAVSFLFVS